MKAVFAELPPDVISLRKTNGSDQRDEMWEGVLHVPPMPNYYHQRLEFKMQSYVDRHWAEPTGGEVLQQINLCKPGIEDWTTDYRVPDLSLVKADRRHINKDTHFEGAPHVVVEIRSPGDETYEKLEFYRELSVPEVWIVDRDTKKPEIHLLRNRRYRKAVPDADGWLFSPETGIEMKQVRGNKLCLRIRGEESTQETIPH